MVEKELLEAGGGPFYELQALILSSFRAILPSIKEIN
jgi:hypothetical protein